MTQKIKKLFIISLGSLLVTVFSFSAMAIAASSPKISNANIPTVVAQSSIGDNCAQFKNDPTKCLNNSNPIVRNLNNIVNVLAGLVGVVVVGTIILGGVQYAMAGDKAEAVSAAKQRIINGLIALFAFIFIFAFLQWLVPGGVF